MSKKVGIKGKVIHAQGREIVQNVANFMKDEAENGITIPIKSYRKRIVRATGISKSTYNRILREGVNIETGASTSFSSHHKNRPRKSYKVDTFTSADLSMIRQIIHNFCIIEKSRPCLDSILQAIKDANNDIQISRSTLHRLLRKMGFRWKKAIDNRIILMESYRIRLLRVQYLKKMIEYRKEGRPIIYTGETYIHSSHTQSKDWIDMTKPEMSLKHPISKGQRLINVHAGGEDGFITNRLLIFKSGSKTGDYHKDMNHSNFMKWVEKQLLPNLPARSVLLIDNASYHNVKIEKSVISTSRKTDMINWLNKYHIPHDPNAYNIELYNIIKSYKEKFVQYSLDALLESHGHKVCRLPPHHPELNAIEKIWATVKNWVATRNTTFKLRDVEKLAREKFASTTKEEWQSICLHVKNYEEELMRKEGFLDTAINNMEFVVNTGSSNEEEEEEDVDRYSHSIDYMSETENMSD